MDRFDLGDAFEWREAFPPTFGHDGGDGEIPLEERIRALIEPMTAFVPRTIAKTLGVAYEGYFRRAMWRATEAIRKETGVVYSPKMGVYRRADPPLKMRRSERFTKAAQRKLVRAKEIVTSIAESDVPPEAVPALQAAKDKVSRVCAMAHLANRMRKDDPVVCEVPQTPRGERL